MGTPTELDLGGMTLVVKDIKVNATGPGQTGTALSTTELSALDGATNANATAAKAVILDANGDISIGTGKTLKVRGSTHTLSSNAATATAYAAVITSEALTTAAGASQAFVITKTGIAAGDLAFVQAAGGTNTRKHIVYEAVTTTDTVTVTLHNIGPTNAVNGTVIFNVWVVKA